MQFCTHLIVVLYSLIFKSPFKQKRYLRQIRKPSKIVLIGLAITEPKTALALLYTHSESNPAAKKYELTKYDRKLIMNETVCIDLSPFPSPPIRPSHKQFFPSVVTTLPTQQVLYSL